MISYSASAIWWGEIPSPSRFCADIVNTIASASIAIVYGATGLPWLEYLSEKIELDLAEKCLRAERLTFPVMANDDIGQFLMERYASKMVTAGYRPVVDVATYLADNDVLGDMLLFLHVPDVELATRWYKFVAHYNQRNRKRTIYLCLFCDATVLPMHKTALSALDCRALADDAVLFAGLLASYRQLPASAQAYVARLAVFLANGDIPLIERLVCEVDLYSQEPAEAMEICLGCSTFSRELTYTVWKAQIQSLFHTLEEKRLAFVDANRAAIASLLPCTDGFGNVVAIPEDVEFGTLAFLMRNDVGKGRLVLQKADEDTLLELKDLRNKLAHRQPLSLMEVRKILGEITPPLSRP